ncbi:hypothetical protein F5Y08DRAFT_335702 [Xylaria arbuscula]|nr:hypothetical protein F5Y08DRAFT_335702 [Xylaria arbuscula]
MALEASMAADGANRCWGNTGAALGPILGLTGLAARLAAGNRLLAKNAGLHPLFSINSTSTLLGSLHVHKTGVALAHSGTLWSLRGAFSTAAFEKLVSLHHDARL